MVAACGRVTCDLDLGRGRGRGRGKGLDQAELLPAGVAAFRRRRVGRPTTAASSSSYTAAGIFSPI